MGWSRQAWNRRLLRVVLGVWLIGFGATASLLASETVKVIFMPAEPWYLKAENGSLTGICVEQASLLIREAGYEPEFIELPWTRALSDMRSGQLDMMLNLSKTAEREEYIQFLGEMAREQNVILLHKDFADVPLNSLDDLAKDDLRWGIRQDVFYTEEFNARLSGDPEFRTHFESQPKIMLNLEKVRNKRIHGTIGEINVIKYAWHRDA